jgi:Flp pilus assembly protein TadD
LAVDPTDVKTLNNKGNALDNLGKHQEAIQYYDKALDLEPNDVIALENKGSALDLLGNIMKLLFLMTKP